MSAIRHAASTTRRRFILSAKRLLQAIPYISLLRVRTVTTPAIFFDSEFYRSTNTGAAAKVSPLMHFLVTGAFHGRKPHPLFDPTFYLARYPDVRKSGINPLVHFLRFGAAEGRKPHPLFQPDYYVSRCPEAKKHRPGPLAHFLRSRAKDCASPHMLFDCESYRRYHPKIAAQDINPLIHYAMAAPHDVAAMEGISQLGRHG